MLLYNFGIYLYACIVWLISPFHRKARKIIKGHKATFGILAQGVDTNAQYIWIHAASLGEFEQGRPIIERIKRDYPHYKILLTFFSPSGYDVRKDYPFADIVCYLPFDKKTNVKRFLRLVKPRLVIFIKYEFWYNYVAQCNKLDIPVYMVSAIFRPDQFFFKWYGKSMQKLLHLYTKICVQDDESVKLLETILPIGNVVCCGDTRFDRVIEIQKEAKKLEVIQAFVESDTTPDTGVLVVGSSWPKDEDIYVPYFNITPDLKLIIAPHEIDEAHLKYIETALKRPSIRYSKIKDVGDMKDYDCVIIDCFGLLSSIYRYGDIAYVGGGFGDGIHNVLEAAVYDIPVIFGPHFKKFREAKQLIENGGAYSVTNYDSFRGLLDEFLQYEDILKTAGTNAGNYVRANQGAVECIMAIIKL